HRTQSQFLLARRASRLFRSCSRRLREIGGIRPPAASKDNGVFDNTVWWHTCVRPCNQTSLNKCSSRGKSGAQRRIIGLQTSPTNVLPKLPKRFVRGQRRLKPLRKFVHVTRSIPLRHLATTL